MVLDMHHVFKSVQIQTSDPDVQIVGRIRGEGPPLLLLHGNPLTQMSWDRIAPRLAEHFTVVTTDLRGYGDSSKPEGKADHANYTFRRMALDQVEVMQALGFQQFGVAGHDRGARTAFRMAMDHPSTVQKVAFLDILPTHSVFREIAPQMALDLYHWWFMAQPKGFPETLLRNNEEYYIRNKLMKQGPGREALPKPKSWSTSGSARLKTSMRCVKTTGRPRHWTLKWTRLIFRPVAKSCRRL